MNTRRWLLLFAATGLCGGTLHAQAQQAPSELGSPALSQATYSTDYRALVQAALPRVDAASLAGRLSAAIKEGASDLAIKDARSWMALFELAGDLDRAQAGEIVDLERGSVRVRPEEGRFWVALPTGEATLYSRTEFARQLPEIRRAHQALAERIGVTRNQIFYTDFREILAQSTPAAGLAGARESAIESAGATSTLLRAAGGLLVDGNYVRITSLDAKRIDMVDVRWPRIVLAPEVNAATVQEPARLTEQLVERVAASAQKRAVGLRMAIVLRPVPSPYRTYFVPSLRVGVRPRSERLKDGYRTDAGEVFYLDLIPGYEERNGRERAPESLERKEESARP